MALRLGLTSFGGPIAHIGYFQDEFVQRRRWVDEETFADLVALSQAFPGAGSSKLGMAIGMARGGLWGGVIAWLGFTLPSAVIMTVLGLTASRLTEDAAGWIHGLVVVAVPVVGLAVWKLWRQLAPDRFRSSIAVLSTLAVIAFPSSARTTIVIVIVIGGIVGWFFLWREASTPRSYQLGSGRRAAVLSAVLFFGLLALLPVVRAVSGSPAVATADAFYGSGALVFGGGPVVLPLLESEVVGPGWVDEDTFIAGFGAAQAVPGPVFTFSAYLGASLGTEPNGIAGALLALVAIFLPSFLIVVATLPTFGALRARPEVQAVLRGVNAAVVGILLAALYDPLWSSAILGPEDFGLALVALGLLAFWKLPPWMVVIVTAAGGGLLATI
ncbi:MAG: chromate efflux transporter [bacterium]|nr:chromate efflux transporter [bacterium]